MDAQNTIEVDDTSIIYPSTSNTIKPPVPSTSCIIWSPPNSRCSLRRVEYSHAHPRQFPTWRTFKSNGIKGLGLLSEGPSSLPDDTGDVGDAYVIGRHGNRLLEGLGPRGAVIGACFHKIKCLDTFIKIPLFLHDNTAYIGNAYAMYRRGAVIAGLFRRINRDATRRDMIALNIEPVGRNRTYEILDEDTETEARNETPSRELGRICLFNPEVRFLLPVQSSRSHFPPLADIAGFEDRIVAFSAGQEEPALSEHEADDLASEDSRAGEHDRLAEGKSASPIQPPFIYLPPSAAMTAGVGNAMPELVVEENELDFYEAEEDLVGWRDIATSHQCAMKHTERARSILNSLHDDSVGGEDRGIFEQENSGCWNGIETVLGEGNVGVSNRFRVDWHSEEEVADDVEEKSYRMRSGVPRVSRLKTIWECEEEE